MLEWDIVEVKRLLDHQDSILSLVTINGKLFVYVSLMYDFRVFILFCSNISELPLKYRLVEIVVTSYSEL